MRLGLALIALLIALPARAAPSVAPSAALVQSRLQYQRHEYKEAEETLKQIVDQLPTEEGVVEAHRLLALSYFFQKKVPEARQEVIAILALKPDFKLDPALEQPVAVSFFENIRKEQEERLREIKLRQVEEAEQARKDDERRRAAEHARAQRVFVEKRVEKHSRLIALLPFGIGQVQNGERGKAALFGTTEAVFGALSLASWIAVQEKFPNAKFDPADKGLAETLLGLQLASGVAFWAMVVAGIIDAEVRFKPEVVRYKELPEGKRKATFNLAPFVSPGLYGLGVNGAF